MVVAHHVALGCAGFYPAGEESSSSETCDFAESRASRRCQRSGQGNLPIVDVAAYDLLENHVASGADQHRPGHLSPKTHQDSSEGSQTNTPESLPREHVADVAVPQVSGVNSASELAHLGISDGSEA